MGRTRLSLSKFDAFVTHCLHDKDVALLVLAAVVKSLVTRWPLEAVLRDKVTRQRVSLGVLLAAQVAHVNALGTIQVLGPYVLSEQIRAASHELTFGERAGLAINCYGMSFEVFPKVAWLLGRVVTLVASIRPRVRVAPLHVVFKRGRSRTRHVTQGALVLVHMVTHVVTQESL